MGNVGYGNIFNDSISCTFTLGLKANELFKCSIGLPPERLVPLDLKSDNIPLVSIHVPAL